MKFYLLAIALLLAGCVKQRPDQWTELHLPAGCKAVAVAAYSSSTAVVCEDGRVFR